MAIADKDDAMTVKKLQGLCLIAQVFHFSVYNETLFPDLITPSKEGPVIHKLIGMYRGTGKNILSTVLAKDDVKAQVSENELFVLDYVYNTFGMYFGF